ncbi:MAG: hypothetical protein JWM34_3723 [Ilumatobacteraceae bacterium]|nr:hypothetical protein [Ilumatobacteraceae bacterium]
MNTPPSSTPPIMLLTRTAHVLICLASMDRPTLTSIADATGYSDRTVLNLVNELVQHGAVIRTRVGRRNRYVVDTDLQVHPDYEATLGHLIVAFHLDGIAPSDNGQRLLT